MSTAPDTNTRSVRRQFVALAPGLEFGGLSVMPGRRSLAMFWKHYGREIRLRFNLRAKYRSEPLEYQNVNPRCQVAFHKKFFLASPLNAVLKNDILCKALPDGL